jgi:flagellar basal body rod protein FlgG
MDVSLYQAAAAMNASNRWQEVISANLASSQIPGFKKQELSFSAVQAGFLARPSGSLPGSGGRCPVPLAGMSTNFQPGELHPSGIATDLAIEGTGFFEVQMPDGTHGYTRDGQYRLNGQGQLTTKHGLLFMGLAGPVQLDANNPGPITVAPSGEVSQGGQVKGRLKISEFRDPSVLTPAGSGLFISTDPAAQPQAATASTVRQGCVENANTSSITEMGNLITAMRLYEANQKVIQTEDDRVSKLISEVSNVS